MAHLNKLDCEYTLEEAKNVDVNDITTHPFFKKHFSKAVKNRVYDSNGDEYVSYKIGKHEIRHYPVNHKYNTHMIEVGTHASRNHFHYYGSGQHKTAHTALESAIKQYKDNVSRFKPLTESLVGKKPATASKLFAEAMEARLDEISKKTLGSYLSKAVVDRDRHVASAAKSRTAIDAVANIDSENRAASDAKHELIRTLSANERKSHKARYKREAGIVRAIGKLTKEDLDEVEAPANFWNAGMARMNPIQVSQKQPAEPGQFKATLTKSPKRLADQDSSLEGKPRAVRDETETVAASRGPKTIELTGDWHADVPDHQFDPKLDSETEYYPLFSQFKSLGAYPSGPARAWESEEIDEDELNELSKKTLSKYVDVAADKLAGHAYLAGGGSGLDKEGKTKEFRKAVNRLKGIKLANKKLSEDSASLMATATKDEKKAAEQDKKKPAEFKKLHDKHETEVKSKMKELGEEALDEGSNSYMKGGAPRVVAYDHGRIHHVMLFPRGTTNKLALEKAKQIMVDREGHSGFRFEIEHTKTSYQENEKQSDGNFLEEGLFDPAKHELLGLWDEHARRSDAHGSGSRNEILKRIEDHVVKKHGQEGLKKMKLHTDLTNALKHSLSPDKGHLQAILGNMRSRCAMGV